MDDIGRTFERLKRPNIRELISMLHGFTTVTEGSPPYKRLSSPRAIAICERNGWTLGEFNRELNRLPKYRND